MAEQRLGPIGGLIRVGADDLRQRAELLERMALGDPLRAEGDVNVAAALCEGHGHELGRARIDGAAKNDQGAIPQMRGDLIDGTVEHAH